MSIRRSAFTGSLIMVVMPDLDIVAVATGTRNYPSTRLIDGIHRSGEIQRALAGQRGGARGPRSRHHGRCDGSAIAGGAGAPRRRKQVSGKVYAFAPNVLNLRTLVLNLNDANPSFESSAVPHHPQRKLWQ